MSLYSAEIHRSLESGIIPAQLQEAGDLSPRHSRQIILSASNLITQMDSSEAHGLRIGGISFGRHQDGLFGTSYRVSAGISTLDVKCMEENGVKQLHEIRFRKKGDPLDVLVTLPDPHAGNFQATFGLWDKKRQRSVIPEPEKLQQKADELTSFSNRIITAIKQGSDPYEVADPDRRILLQATFALAVADLLALFCSPPPPPRSSAGVTAPEIQTEYQNAVLLLHDNLRGGELILTTEELNETIDRIIVDLQYLQGYSDAVHPIYVNEYTSSTSDLRDANSVAIARRYVYSYSNVNPEFPYGRIANMIHEKLHTQFLAHGCFIDYIGCQDNEWPEILVGAGEILLLEKLFPELNFNDFFTLPFQYDETTSFLDILSIWIKRTGKKDEALVAIIRGDNEKLRTILDIENPRHREMLDLLHDNYRDYIELSLLYYDYQDGKILPDSPDLTRYTELASKFTTIMDKLAKFALFEPLGE